ncbi:M-protein, striated muscle-like [Acipenser oxyrinchus oxyrinchus]|uniref:M-protein, striated muscle-like n=1 Tax=Acipenser oxyrinchus oxyrinchus TaxID=40147 RepID=A0AAD8LPT4_ACIOX|nr:M-protein, striated muscle-like [Acipenser oxyrinchus oxyrinchus]
MASKALPFYQRKHKHYDQDYRSTQTRYLVQEYSASSSRASSSKSRKLKSTVSAQAVGSRSPRVSPHSKSLRSAADEETVEFTEPPFRNRSVAEEEEYKRRVVHFGNELSVLEHEVRKAREATRHQVDKLAIQRVVEEKMAFERQFHEECMIRAPEFLVRLRTHTVWEKTPMKLFCTVEGYPNPVVKWFKDNVIIDPTSEPGKYRIESKYGVHSLEIHRCEVCDTAQYTAIATNVHGQTSTNASVIVQRIRVDKEPYHSVMLPIQLPVLPEITYPKIDIMFLEKFDVTFGTEGDTLTLVCKMVIAPELANLQPDAQWYRDDVRIKESKWAEMKFGAGVARLTLTHLNKDDEGLYTLRMVTKGGSSQHCAYIFVRDAESTVAGAPGAPMSIKIHDANKDYAIVSWKPPNITSESPVTGYFLDRCEVGTENWIQRNDSPIKICKYPVHGLSEGRSYIYRVRAVNNKGISRPSRVSEAVAALDPADLARLQVIHLERGKQTVIGQDELEGDVKIPGPPTNLHASETSKIYIVLSWEPPAPRGRDSLMYYIEKSMVGSGNWQRVNTEIPVRSPRYAVFDLAEGKQYLFRVLAVNKFGISNASEPTAPIQVQELYGAPSAPGRILATRNTKTSVVVQWDPPKQAGGLIGYYIDSSVVSTKYWETCNHKPVKHTRFVVHGLTTGKNFIFRVKAVNDVGFSEESQESSPINVQAALTSPSPPYGITLLACDGHSMTLGWKYPRYSGGSKVTAYYIDQRDVADLHWKETNVFPIKEIIYKVENLKEGSFYEFRIQAANLAGVGLPSDASDPFKCEAWVMPEPGPSYDLTFCEIRNTSLVIQWRAPVYSGASAVTGYHVDICKVGSEEWKTVNEKAVNHRYLKVSDLEEAKSYVFRVRAVNAAGVGKSSDTSEPVFVQTRPGTLEIASGVDEEGNIYLNYECNEMTDFSQFVWCKSYGEITEFSRVNIETEGQHSKIVFKNPDKEDLGTYSVSVTGTEGVSASYVLEDKEFEKLMALSREIKNPMIPLKTELSYEIFEKGQVRFWVQAEKLSSAVNYKFIVNEQEVTNSETHKITCASSTGIIEMVMDKFTAHSEGTYTVQIQDGKAKNQSSLVLIGDVFKAALEEAEFQRKEYLRKQGPHFLEYLYWHVEEDCTVMLICKVANIKKETVFHWYKDEVQIIPEKPTNAMSGICILPIPQFSKKDQGVFKATLTDDRGQDVSIFDIAGEVFEDIINSISRIAGSSASELKIQCTPEGIRLQCSMKYYTEEMRIVWSHKDTKISSSEKMRIGGTSEQVWMQICGPTEKDKGKYTIEILDDKQSYHRTVDLSGQAYDNAYAEFQKLKQAAFAENNRGKVIGGLPDVVTIMENKTLSLTCTVFGDPTPEVVWYKNEKKIELDDHFSMTLEQGKYANLTINGVTTEDSGKYGINVRNKCGGETVDVTVSVYKYEDDVPAPKPGQMPKPAAHPAQSRQQSNLSPPKQEGKLGSK